LVYTDEPHATRRREMLKKYPQIKELFGYDSRSKYIALFFIFAQLFIGICIAPTLTWPSLVALAYCFGGIAAHNLFLAMHELCHNLFFQQAVHNRIFGVFTNFATVFPHFSMFSRYHIDHHRYQGVENVDVDIPTRHEAVFFQHLITKFLWVLIQPLFYIFRPLIIKPKDPGFWEMVNWSACFAFDFLLYWLFGGKALSYLMISAVFASGLHPVAGHFIAEHYAFLLTHETYSYYGPLNFLSFWVGYHNEHHDFPRIPGIRLHQLHEIAPEYYDTLPCHNSWVKTMWDYIVDPRVGPWSRIMRKNTKDEPL